MGFFNKVKGMIVEEEEPCGQTPPARNPTTSATTQTSSRSPTFTPTTMVNQVMVDTIRKETFSRNTALTALMTASDALADIIPDPTMRLKAAQKTAGGGRSGKDIADAVAIHLNDVDSAELRFGQALSTKIQTEVGGLTQQATAAEQAINSMQHEIQTLTQKLQQLQTTINEQTQNVTSLRSQAQTKEAELRQAETEFKAAAQAVRNELNGHKSTILSTLG